MNLTTILDRKLFAKLTAAAVVLVLTASIAGATHITVPNALPALLLVGCAHSNPPQTAGDPGPLPQKHDAPDTASVRTPEQLKAYPVGRYEDPNDPDVMHEGHTV